MRTMKRPGCCETTTVPGKAMPTSDDTSMTRRGRCDLAGDFCNCWQSASTKRSGRFIMRMRNSPPLGFGGFKLQMGFLDIVNVMSEIEIASRLDFRQDLAWPHD